MRKYLLLILVMIVGAISAPNAHADTYTATFNLNAYSTTQPTAPDVTFGSPTNVVETWDGYTMTVPLASADSPTDTYLWSDIMGDGADFDFDYTLAFVIYDETTSIASIVYENVNFPYDDYSTGPLTFTDSRVATPEPSSGGFVLIGVGMLGLAMMRRRMAQSLPQAS